jgi:hypothetical protein
MTAAAELNLFEAAIIEADKDNFTYKKAQYLDKSMFVHADDYFQVSALLNNGVKRLSVADDFIDIMAAHPTFNRTISGYKHLLTDVYLATKQLPLPFDKTLYETIYRLTIKPDKYTVLIYDRNTFFIKIFNLAHFSESRYCALVKALIECEVFVHNARVENPTKKHKCESMRLILKRDFKMNEYEWSMTFNSQISRILLPVIQREAIENIDGCYYLNKGKRIQCKIKVYNVSAMAEGRRGKPYRYITGDLMKFEVTFQHEFFIHHEDATITSFTSQIAVFSLLLTYILKQFNQHLLNKLTTFEKNNLYQATSTTKGTFMQKLMNPESLQTMLDTDLQALKNQLRALFTVIEANTSAVSRNTVATEAHTVAMIANTAALTAANHSQFLAESSAFLSQQEKQLDKRKLRVV